MSPEPKLHSSILVVMPLYNARNFVEKAAMSILSQTFTDYTLLIIDDGSTDGSSELVKHLIGENVLVVSQANSGPGVAMNRAIQYAHENQIPYVARMDADDLSMPTRLAIQFSLLHENPNAAACSANCYYIDSLTEQIVGTSTVASRPSIIKWEIKNGLRGLIQGACLFRTSALIEIGGYRPQFRYAEEVDLFLRLMEKFDLINAREYLYKIRINKNSLSLQNPQKNILYQFYALECWRKRKIGQSEGDFEAFLHKLGWRLSFRIHREEVVLRLWRGNIANRNIFLIMLASLVDPRRIVVRILRKL